MNEMEQLLRYKATIRKPNMLILDVPINIDSEVVNVWIEPIKNKVSEKSILGMFQGQIKISDDFDETDEIFKDYI